MSFTASISGHAPSDGTPEGDAAATAVEQSVANGLKAAVDAAPPGAITSASFSGSFVTADLTPGPPPPPPVDPDLVAVAADLRTQADTLDAKAAGTATPDAALTLDAKDLRAIADALDPAGAVVTPPVVVPPEPGAPFVVKIDGEQYSDYLARLTAFNADPANAPVGVLDLTDWTAAPVG